MESNTLSQCYTGSLKDFRDVAKESMIRYNKKEYFYKADEFSKVRYAYIKKALLEQKGDDVLNLGRKIILCVLYIINFIFLVLLFSERRIKLGCITYLLISISLVLIVLNNFKNKDKIIGILFLVSLLLLSINFVIK